MKADTFFDSVGMIDEKFLDVDNRSSKIRHSKTYVKIAAAAAAAILLICPLPAMTAFGHDHAYNLLYQISPSIAQTFKPVMKSCSNNGFELTVISAEADGNKASVYLAMHDTTESCPFGDWDLYDSYSINTPRDMIGRCSFSEYDSQKHTAYFVIELETMDGSDIPDSKVTFCVTEMLLGKTESSGYIDSIDMNAVQKDPETVSPDSLFTAACRQSEPDPSNYNFLTPEDVPLCSPAKGASIMNIGYIDDALHILVRYDDKYETDNHGYISLIDNTGNSPANYYGISFSYLDASGKNNYVEQVFKIPYEKLKDFSLYGEFSTTQMHVKGDWEVTFKLK